MRALRIVVILFATFLLVTMGGAIFAAPITVPLLVVAARSTKHVAYRVWAGVVFVATIAEVVWALTYLAVGEAKPTIWLAPLLASAAAVFAYARLVFTGASARSPRGGPLQGRTSIRANLRDHHPSHP